MAPRWLVAALAVTLAAAACGSGVDTATTSSTTASSSTTTVSSSTTSTTTTAPSPPASTTTTAPSPPASTTTSVAPAGPAIVVSRGSTTTKVVALTFDAGSDTGNAAAILDVLAVNGISAAFGLTGQWTRATPDLVRRMAAEGHLLVNHTDDHRSFTGYSTSTAPLTRSERFVELDRADAAIRAVTGASSAPWFRPPYGDRDASVDADVGAHGYRYELMWTVDSLGWKGVAPSAVVARCLAAAAPGAIYLLHVGADSTDAAALQPVIDGLRAAGYGFARVDTLVP